MFNAIRENVKKIIIMEKMEWQSNKLPPILFS